MAVTKTTTDRYYPSASSPKFPIARENKYLIECKVARDVDALTYNRHDSTPFVNGVGMRLTFYDASNNHLTATGVYDHTLISNYSPQLNHKLIPASQVPTGNSGVAFLSMEVDAALSPSLCTQASLDLVCYGLIDTVPKDGAGSFYWSDPSVSIADPYFYCTEDHQDSSVDASSAPTGYASKWSSEFIFKPSYGSQVNFSASNQEHKLGDGYTEYLPKSTNSLKCNWSLRFENRSDNETKAIIHFLENHKGAKNFLWTPPYPYDKKSKFKCESFNTTYNKENSNTVTANFIRNDADIANWKNAFSPYTGVWDNSYVYKENDYVGYVDSHELMNHDKYYFCKKDAPAAENPKNSIHWNNDHFFWVPSEGQTINFKPKIKTIDLRNNTDQTSPEDVNSNLLKLNLSFNSRSSKESAAISNFLQHKIGAQSFTSNLPVLLADNQTKSVQNSATNSDSFNVGRIEISGSETMSLALGSALSLPQDLDRLYENQEIIFADSASTHNKFYLDQDAINGTSTIKVKTRNHAGPIANGSSFQANVSTSRFLCNSWSHSYIFKDHESVSMYLRECPLEIRSTQGSSGLRYESDLSFHGWENMPDLNIVYHTGLFIENTGVDNLIIASMSISNDTHGAFGLSYQEVPSLSPDFPYVIEAGTSQEVYFSYDPRVTLDMETATQTSECLYSIVGSMRGEVANIHGSIVGNPWGNAWGGDNAYGGNVLISDDGDGIIIDNSSNSTLQP